MVVDDLDVVRIPIPPDKANPKLLVDPNGVLTVTITSQRLEMVSRTEIRQRGCSMESSQRAARGIAKAVERRDTFALDEALGALVATAPNHISV
ncbi:MAG TPA: hypothetical protein VFS67_27760 [Polyangiaceae bacterium]|nr:hypothetical protein [Polyangiaceae bacterium]